MTLTAAASVTAGFIALLDDVRKVSPTKTCAFAKSKVYKYLPKAIGLALKIILQHFSVIHVSFNKHVKRHSYLPTTLLEYEHKPYHSAAVKTRMQTF